MCLLQGHRRRGSIIYNANYLKFMERARTEFLRAGVEQDVWLQEGYAFVVSRAGSFSAQRPVLMTIECINASDWG